MQVGFLFREQLKGVFHPIGEMAGGRKIEFRITATTPSFKKFFDDFMCDIKGELSAEGIAKKVPCEGKLEIALLTRSELVYELFFKGDDGSSYRLLGKKNIKALQFPSTITTLFIKLFRDGEEYASGIMRFNWWTFHSYLFSHRLVF